MPQFLDSQGNDFSVSQLPRSNRGWSFNGSQFVCELCGDAGMRPAWLRPRAKICTRCWTEAYFKALKQWGRQIREAYEAACARGEA
jgi:hypothetical protein